MLAIIITIMVLELKRPEGPSFGDLWQTRGSLLSYLLSFVYVGIYWNNHHHMFQLVERISGVVLWANLALLFCLSLFPFTTEWMDETRFAYRTPVIVYGINLFAAAIAYYVLQTLVIRQQGPDSPLREAIGTDIKGKISPVFYIAGIISAVADPGGDVGIPVALACFIAVAVMWVIPDRRIERALRERQTANQDLT